MKPCIKTLSSMTGHNNESLGLDNHMCKEFIMEENTNLFLKKSFVAITGASRGLGRCIAQQFASKLPSSSVMVLMARTVETLETVKSEITVSAPGITVFVKRYDQGSVNEADYFQELFDNLLLENKLSSKEFEQYVIVHNCGRLNDLSKKALQMSNPSEVRAYFDMNLTGMILLNSSFLRTFSDSKKSRVVINMTSAASCVPIRSVHLYAAGKAARDMFFRVLAIEEPTIRILTYAPGLSYTDMLDEFINTTHSSEEGAIIRNMQSEGKIVSPNAVINRLVTILEENTFENAAFVDYNETLLK